MNDLEKYRSHVIEQRPANFEPPPESAGHSTSNLIMGVLRRWYIVLLIFFVMCAIGIPAIWFSIEPLYSVTGAIRVAPILANILTGEADRGEISNYDNFMNTQAQMITSSQVVQRVATDLADKNLAYFENEPTGLVTKLKQTLKNTKAKPESASILKQAISNGVISAASDRRTEFIKITMQSMNASEAKQIVDAFISAYMAVEGDSSIEYEGQKLTALVEEQRVQARNLEKKRIDINALAQKFGSKSLDKRQEIKLERVGMLLSEVTKWEANRISLEAQVEVLKNRLELPDANTQDQTTEQEKLATAVQQPVDQNDPTRRSYINADPTLIAFIANLTLLEQELIVAELRFAPTNPELRDKAVVIETLKERIEQRKTEVGEMYDGFMAKKIVEAEKEKLLNAENELANAQAELELTRAYEQRFKDMLAKEDTETIDVGRRQLDIQELQDEMSLTKETYDRIGRRIQELEMERKRPARISVAYNADVASIRDKRVKYSAALVFGAFACGMLLAFLRDRADQRLRTPDDVVKRIGIRIIGTTTSSDTIKRAALPRQMAGDYQTIRANLRLLNGDRMPKKLVITSPALREGKTTFAINLAISMSRSGNKVLLIDGDLRKPDIAHLLNISDGSKGLHDVLFGRDFDQAVCFVPSVGLDVLAPNSRNGADAYELLALPGAAQRINTISQKYDHVIIDTPPMLAFPDALVWAKMADGVILTSFAGHTTAPDLREANEKLAQINVNVLGTVLSNVDTAHSYYRYGHNYHAQNTRSRKNAKRAGANLLSSTQSRKRKKPADGTPNGN
ncbi:MAG TPA: polysaccharide biosynthesis tyrosine autokinase [Planctomycetes bacterium]|nr:polysaccharide biosynthesis tyrosine autokinase [Planctomycetota bacterium]